MSAVSQQARDGNGLGRRIGLGRLDFVADPLGALFCLEERLLVVSDLHLEKGSAYAARGRFLPPYDSAATLNTMLRLVARYEPRRIISLGDSFHDDDGPVRLSAEDAASLRALQAGRDFVWIAGNHDPSPPVGFAGEIHREIEIGGVVFRHEPRAFSREVGTGSRQESAANQGSADNDRPEIAGHLHPAAKVRLRGRGVRRRCFAADGRRIVMPALGAYAGGLNVLDEAFAPLFSRRAFMAHMLGDARLYAVDARLLLGD